MEEQQLAGGIANAGLVVRVGGHVLRPSNPNTASIHAYLAKVRAAGFGGASLPVGVDVDGRERLDFIEGDVPVLPFPAWAQTDEALASITVLIRDLHAAAEGFDFTGLTWCDEMADPAGGGIVCHNDVCLENVVFRNGIAVGLLDFDFAAPGRPVWDIARFARMCVPVDDDTNATLQGWTVPDRPARLRLVADTYGLTADSRVELIEVLDQLVAGAGEFVRRRVENGEQAFIDMWNSMGGAGRFDRQRRWWDEHRKLFVRALS